MASETTRRRYPFPELLKLFQEGDKADIEYPFINYKLQVKKLAEPNAYLYVFYTAATKYVRAHKESGMVTFEELDAIVHRAFSTI